MVNAEAMATLGTQSVCERTQSDPQMFSISAPLEDRAFISCDLYRYPYPVFTTFIVRDRMVVVFITTYVISAYHHWCCEFESRSGRGVLDKTLCDKVCL
jgi:hypothetical protein